MAARFIVMAKRYIIKTKNKNILVKKGDKSLEISRLNVRFQQKNKSAVKKTFNSLLIWDSLLIWVKTHTQTHKYLPVQWYFHILTFHVLFAWEFQEVIWMWCNSPKAVFMEQNSIHRNNISNAWAEVPPPRKWGQFRKFTAQITYIYTEKKKVQVSHFCF